MTPQDALAKAFATAWCSTEHDWHEESDERPCLVAQRVAGVVPLDGVRALAGPILAALAADGWTVARTQDAKDGEALRRLEALMVSHQNVLTIFPPAPADPTFAASMVPGPLCRGASIGDALRAAIEAIR